MAANFSKLSLLLLGLLFTFSLLMSSALSSRAPPGEDAEKTQAISDSKDTSTYRGYMQRRTYNNDDDDQYGRRRGGYGYPGYGVGRGGGYNVGRGGGYGVGPGGYGNGYPGYGGRYTRYPGYGLGGGY